MADGIPYVPLDCRLDEKFDYIEAEFGLVGFAVVVKLFQRIYGGHGYYCEWNDRVALLFAHQIGAKGGSVVLEVVAACIREGIFDEGIFKQYGVLTSRGIQKRFLKVAKRRQQIFDKPEYTLLCCDQNSADVNISGENVCNSDENVCNSGTSKGKASKLNVSEAKQSDERSALCQKYGENNVRNYEQRFERWKSRQPSVKAEMYPTIGRWMEQDGVVHGKSDSSFDVDGVVEDVYRRYADNA